MIRSVRRKSRARLASAASIGLTPPSGAASTCSRAMRSMKTARKAGLRRRCARRRAAHGGRAASRASCRGRRRSARLRGRRSAGRATRAGTRCRRTAASRPCGRRRAAARPPRAPRPPADACARSPATSASRAVDPEVETGRRIRLRGSRTSRRPRAPSSPSSMSSHDASVGLVEGQAERQGPERAVVRCRAPSAGRRGPTRGPRRPGSRRSASAARVAAKRRRHFFAQRAHRHAGYFIDAATFFSSSWYSARPSHRRRPSR